MDSYVRGVVKGWALGTVTAFVLWAAVMHIVLLPDPWAFGLGVVLGWVFPSLGVQSFVGE